MPSAPDAPRGSGSAQIGDDDTVDATACEVVVSKDGPYQVTGGVPLTDQVIVANEAGESVDWREGERYPTQDRYTLCRCGRSRRKPFCDGTHVAIGFDGTETASRTPYREEAACIDGPVVKLLDARRLCAEARFCDREGGLWNRIGDCDDPGVRADVETQAAQCPAGRYVPCDAVTDEAREPELPPSIGLIQDPQMGVLGPVWVRGGVRVTSADGVPYEVRNRVTLCRCGQSRNKPFCDGLHIAAGFTGEG